MNSFLEVLVPLGIFIMLLLIASATSNAIFVVLSGFVRFVRAWIGGKALRRRLRAGPIPTSAANDRGAFGNAASR